MALTLLAAEVATLTGSTVTANDITVAAALIDQQTGNTVDEHVDDRLIASAAVKAAWAIVAVRVRSALVSSGQGGISSETQGDYSYAEAVTLARHYRFANVTDGDPEQMLNIARGCWSHV